MRLAPTSVSCSSGHFHTGDDIAGPDRTDVMAADTGVARVFRTGTGYGNYVIITHGQGWATLYGHLHDVVVKDGDLVQRGDLIAREGSTGKPGRARVARAEQLRDDASFRPGNGKGQSLRRRSI